MFGEVRGEPDDGGHAGQAESGDYRGSRAAWAPAHRPSDGPLLARWSPYDVIRPPNPPSVSRSCPGWGRAVGWTRASRSATEYRRLPGAWPLSGPFTRPVQELGLDVLMSIGRAFLNRASQLRVLPGAPRDVSGHGLGIDGPIEWMPQATVVPEARLNDLVSMPRPLVEI